MTERKTITSLDRRPHLGIKAFVNNNLASLQPDRAKDVRLRSEPTAWNLEPTVQVVELDMKLQMLLDDILDRDWGSYRHSSGMRKLRKQGLGVAFNGLIHNVGNSKRHLVRSLSASSNARTQLYWYYFSFALCACRASRAISSALSP